MVQVLEKKYPFNSFIQILKNYHDTKSNNKSFKTKDKHHRETSKTSNDFKKKYT